MGEGFSGRCARGHLQGKPLVVLHGAFAWATVYPALARNRQQIAVEIRRAYLDHQSAQEQLKAAEAQKVAADQAVGATQERYRVGAATLVELTQTRATQVQAASALVNARYNLVFQDALMTYYTGDLDPAKVSLGA